MPLTPADVRNKQFSTTRLRPGYDEEEVDAFLDEVEAELDRLIQENEELRGKLAECLRGKVPPAGMNDFQPQEPPAPQEAPKPEMPMRQQPEPMRQQQPEPAQAAAPPMGLPGGDDNMDTAARVLALAQQTADQAISDARREADETLGRARHEAEDILGKARRQAEQIVNEARARSENLDRDAQERHRQVMGSLVQQRDELEHKVAALKDFEREYRSRLKDYFERQLRELNEGAPDYSNNPNTTGGFQTMSPPTGGSPSLQHAGPGSGSTNPFASPEPAPHGYHP
ncbi:DivIVA domain-containing protein, partial [Thermobifida halotolerans]